MVKTEQEIRWLDREAGLYLSYLPAAPDHGRPELAVVRQGRPPRVVVAAVGEEAESLFGRMTLEEAERLLQTEDW